MRSDIDCSLMTISLVVILFHASLLATTSHGSMEYKSALGDPGMRKDGLRVALEGWNECNEVGEEAPGMGSPREADCFNIERGSNGYKLKHIVTEQDNKLRAGDPFYKGHPTTTVVDIYASQKELYLGKKCQNFDTRSKNPSQFWMIMLKNGNMDTTIAPCPRNGIKTRPPITDRTFPCFGKGCMNQPLVYHNYTTIVENTKMRGSFYGSYDLDANRNNIEGQKNISLYFVRWEKEIGKGGWSFHHYLRTSWKYPWLMLYFRADATKGFSGGYHYETRGMARIIPESPSFKVKLHLTIHQSGGPNSQFYLLDLGGCWKNTATPCDGDVTTDVTRYTEMILNPDIIPWCRPDNLQVCPPYHTFSNNTRVHRNDTKKFPYDAYHMYCSPGNAMFPEEPYNLCDPYSNPQPQEIIQILPHEVWGEYGFPTTKGQGWIGDSKAWELDAGRLSQSLYFYQDPGTPPVRRQWPSVDVGTEIYLDPDQVAEWTLSDFDVLVPKHIH